MPYRLVTLGELSLRDAETGRRLAIPKKALALMAVLASADRESVSRERILSLLWPSSESSGRGALKQTFYELRQTLGNHSVLLGTAELSLDSREITADVIDLERSFRAEDWTGAVNGYAGPFLDQFHLKDSPEFDHWVDRTRQRYSELFRKALQESASAAEKSGDVQGAVERWRRLSAEDPLDGRAALGLLNALDAGGDQAGALKHYAVHQRLIRDELGTEPEPAVTSAAERIRAKKNEPGNGSASRAPSAAGTGTAQHEGRSEPAGAPAPQGRLVRRRRWIAFTVSLLAIAGIASGVAWSERGRARIIGSIRLPNNASMRVTADVDLDKIYTDGGASFDNALAVVNGESHQLRLVPHGSGVAVDALTHWYWSGDYGGRFVVIRNGRTNAEIGRIAVPGCPHQLASVGAWMLVAQQCDDQISVLDSRTRKLVRNIPIATLSRAEVGGAKGMGEIFFNPNTGIAYFWKDMLPHRLDTRTWEIRETPEFGGAVMGVDSANNRLYAQIVDGLRVIDGTSERVIANVALPGSLLGRVAVGFGGKRLYAATSRGLLIIDGRTSSVLRTISFPGGFVPDAVAADDSRGRVYAIGSEANGNRTLKIVDVRD